MAKCVQSPEAEASFNQLDLSKSISCSMSLKFIFPMFWQNFALVRSNYKPFFGFSEGKNSSKREWKSLSVLGFLFLHNTLNVSSGIQYNFPESRNKAGRNLVQHLSSYIWKLSFMKTDMWQPRLFLIS